MPKSIAVVIGIFLLFLPLIGSLIFASPSVSNVMLVVYSVLMGLFVMVVGVWLIDPNGYGKEEEEDSTQDIEDGNVEGTNDNEKSFPALSGELSEKEGTSELKIPVTISSIITDHDLACTVLPFKAVCLLKPETVEALKKIKKSKGNFHLEIYDDSY